MTNREIDALLECADCEETKECIELLDYSGKLDYYICYNCNEKRYDRIMESFYG